MPQITAILPLAEGVEEAEAVVLVDVLRRAGLAVQVLGLTPKNPVLASRGMLLSSEGLLSGREQADLLMLPGGAAGAERLASDDRVLEMISRFDQQGKWLAAICAAPIALAAAGILSGRKVTSHPSVRETLERAGVDYSENSLEVDGHLVTGRGPGVSFQFALALVEQLLGREIAAQVRGPMMFANE